MRLAYYRPCADVYKALADPTRRAILDELTERDGQTLFELCTRLTMKHGLGSSRQAISQHLDVLEAAGLVRHASGRADTSSTTSTPAPLREIAERWPPPDRGGRSMRINVTSVLVDDQDKALEFYTDVLGFVKKTEIPLGEARWLTVVSPEDPDGTELLLEPDAHPAAGPFKAALVAGRHPVHLVRRRRRRAPSTSGSRVVGVRFTQEPLDMGPVTTAVFDDTCGNLIQIASQG